MERREQSTSWKMSFLAGRLAGKEAAYFFQESKQAVGKLAQKNPLPKTNNNNLNFHEGYDHADVLPEVLRHSLPSKVFRNDEATSFSFSASKWVLHSDPKTQSSVSPDALNPLRAYLSLPQVTFGPKRFLHHSSISIPQFFSLYESNFICIMFSHLNFNFLFLNRV